MFRRRKIDKQTGATGLTELMSLARSAKAVVGHAIFSRDEFYICRFGVHEQISILGADGTCASGDFACSDIRDANGELDGATVAIGLVSDEIRFRHVAFVQEPMNFVGVFGPVFNR